jgi:hypothetical protein
MSWAQERRNQARKKLRLVNSGKLLQRTDPLATAFHEGAHAVFNEGFGTSVIWATCYPFLKDGVRLLGYVKSHEGGLLNAQQATVETLAGDIAEYPLIWGREYKFDGHISSSDGEEIIKVWKACNMEFSSLELKYASEVTAELVRETKHWITPVAIELYAQKTIQGEQIRAVLKEADFYTPQNPLLQFHLQSGVMRILCIGKMGGLEVPRMEDGGIPRTVLMKWFSDNAAVLQPLLLDRNAEWNQKHWGNGYEQNQEVSPEQIKELVTSSNILKKFGAHIADQPHELLVEQ